MIVAENEQDDETILFIDEFIEEEEEVRLPNPPSMPNPSFAEAKEQEEQQHFRSTLAICCCTFTHSWLLVSVFPYSAFMVIHLVPNTNEEQAGTYAGLLAASFMIGRALTSYGWGRISDIYGRKIVFYSSLSTSCLFCFLFGMATSFRMALVWRFLLGASNGIAGISKSKKRIRLLYIGCMTMYVTHSIVCILAVVTETAHGNERWETKGMSLTMGMWAWGFLLSPGLSGFLSDPLRQYPHLKLPTIFRNVLQRHPFLLPNLVSVLLCTIDLVAVWCLVPETLPNPRSSRYLLSDTVEWFQTIWQRISSSHSTTNNLRTIEDDNDDDEIESLLPSSDIELSPTRRAHATTATVPTTQSQPTPATLSSIWSKPNTRNHLIVFWIFSFVGIAIDEAFPLFCISRKGGLGLDEAKIGTLLSATGVMFAVTQYKAYDWVVGRYGLHQSILIGASLSAPLAALVPVSLLLNHNSDSQQPSSLTWPAFTYLALLLGFIRIFGLVFFASITIATNRTVSAQHRGSMNGLSMLGGSISKGLGPIVAGLLTTRSMSSNPKLGSLIVFGTIGLCSAGTVWIAWYLLGSEPNKNDAAAVEEDGRPSTNLDVAPFQEATVRRRSVATD